MQKYSKYKDSGVKWLGEIPSHWKVVKSKYLWKESFAVSDSGREKLLSVSQYDGVTPTKSDSRSESLKGYKIVSKNDLVINIMLAWMGGLGVSKYEGIVSPAYCIYKLCDSSNPRFLHFLYKTPLYLAEFARRSSGVIPSRWRMYTDDFGQVLSLLPPRKEQDAIVSYLDSVTSKIDNAIAQQQKMIDLLNERKQIIINDAVTKGLDPKAKMKDSGIDWIGQIPEHWNFVKLKHLSTIISKGTTPSTIGRDVLSSGNIRFIKAENIVNNGVSIYPEFYIDETTQKMLKRSNLKANDLLFVIAGATIGKVAILPKELTPANTNQAISFIRLINQNNVKYVWLVLQSDIIKKYIWENAVQSAQPNISMEDLGNIQIPLPASEEEQLGIITYAERQTEPIEESIDICNRQIALLQERKQIIINDVVTGKVKVA